MLACLMGLLTGRVALADQATLTVNVARPGPKISPMLYGIFFEEINHAGDGGLYAELVRNRSFEDGDKPEYWKFDNAAGAKGEWALDTSRALNPANPRCLRIRIPLACEK